MPVCNINLFSVLSVFFFSLVLVVLAVASFPNSFVHNIYLAWQQTCIQAAMNLLLYFSVWTRDQVASGDASKELNNTIHK